MGFLVKLIVISIVALVGKGILGYTLLLPFVLAYSFKVKIEESQVVAIVSGVVQSLLMGSLLGRESLGFLLAVGLIHLYERRFSSKHWLFLVIFAALGSLVYSLISGRNPTFTTVILDVICMLLILQIVMKLREKFGSDNLILKV